MEEEYYSEEDTQLDKYLTFKLGEESYGIDIRFINEIIGIQKITELPEMPKFIKGIINLRGDTIPVMDLRLRFKMKKRKYDPRTCIIVVENEGTRFGLIVDTVSEVLDIPEENVDPPVSRSFASAGKYIQGIGKTDDKVTILLNISEILTDKEIEKIENI